MSSQGQEDAILARIFAMIGTTNRYCVEVGARDGVKNSNTYALRAQGWTGLLLDSHPQASTVRKVHVTAENIAKTFTALDVPREFDLLSIDVDGNDLYLWKALDGFAPRVVVIEYNSKFSPEQSVAIAYRPDHLWDKTDYYGASAAALVTLAGEKGYRLVDYTPRMNLVFVQTSALEGLDLAPIPVPPAEPFGYPMSPKPWVAYPLAAPAAVVTPAPKVKPRPAPRPTRHAKRTAPIATVPQLWPGGTVACLATGPSLTQADVDYVRGKVDGVIAINDAYRLAPWADVLYACDAKWWHWHKGVPSFAGLKYTLQADATQYPGVQYLQQTGADGLESKPTGLKTGKTSGYQAIGLAVHLGAKRIVLLGYDMRGDHFFGRHPDGTKPPFQVCKPKFKTLVEPLKAAGVAVLNCTRSTALDAFPIVPLEEALP